jgi:hypothetical protein
MATPKTAFSTTEQRCDIWTDAVEFPSRLAPLHRVFSAVAIQLLFPLTQAFACSTAQKLARCQRKLTHQVLLKNTYENLACFCCGCDRTVEHRRHFGAERKHDERWRRRRWLDGWRWMDGWLRWGMAADFGCCRGYRSRRMDRQSRRKMTEDAHRLDVAAPALFATLLNQPRSLS